MEYNFIQKVRNIKLKDCIQEFRCFLNLEFGNTKLLDEQLDSFAKFNFSNLFDENHISDKAGNNEYIKNFYYKLQQGGKGDGEKHHEDSTRLARIVYYIIHNNENETEYSLPDLRNFFDITYNNYSGETLNNFNLTCIGNFMLLPKITYERKSLNTVKGMTCYGYNDYFDLFWTDVFNVLKHIPCANNDLIEKIINSNGFYFDNLIQENSQSFIKKNCLEDYFDKENKPKIIYTHSMEDNCDKIKAQKLIYKRSLKIIKVLLSVIKNYEKT